LVPIENEFQRAGLLVFMPIESLAISGGWRATYPGFFVMYRQIWAGRMDPILICYIFRPALKAPNFRVSLLKTVKNTGYPLRNHFSKW
jgi:hypothetical protein